MILFRIVHGSSLVLLLAQGLVLAEDKPLHRPASIEITPKTLTLNGPRDVRRVIVTGIGADGSRVDLSGVATFAIPDGGVAFDAAGFAHPVKDGSYFIKVTAAGKTIDLPVSVKDAAKAAPVSFVRDVMPALSRVGCNAGTCHGSAAPPTQHPATTPATSAPG